MSSVTNALSKTSTFVYDAYGNLLLTTDPLGNQVSASYDVRGHKLTTSDPDLGTWRYSYDVLGELISQTDAKGQVTSFVNGDGSPGYDLLGRPRRRVEADLTSAWSYDTAANGIGQIAQATGSAAGYTRIHLYDTHGRPKKVMLSIAGVSHVYLAAYNSDSRLDTLTYPSGLVVKYVYTQLGTSRSSRTMRPAQCCGRSTPAMPSCIPPTPPPATPCAPSATMIRRPAWSSRSALAGAAWTTAPSPTSTPTSQRCAEQNPVMA